MTEDKKTNPDDAEVINRPWWAKDEEQCNLPDLPDLSWETLIEPAQQVVCMAERWILAHRDLEEYSLHHLYRDIQELEDMAGYRILTMRVTEKEKVDYETIPLSKVEVAGAAMALYGILDLAAQRKERKSIDYSGSLQKLMDDSGFWEKIIPCRTDEERTQYWGGLILPLIAECWDWEIWSLNASRGVIFLRAVLGKIVVSVQLHQPV